MVLLLATIALNKTALGLARLLPVAERGFSSGCMVHAGGSNSRVVVGARPPSILEKSISRP
jgi:hypothetical protein